MEQLAALTLARLPGLTQAQAIVLMRHYGTAVDALADASPDTADWARALHDRAGRAAARERAERELAFCRERGIRVIPFTSDEYPRLLQSDEIGDPPPVLFYRGTGSLNRRHVLSVVGTRRITEYGKDLCERFFTRLAELVPDVLVVSGLAYGVDIHAHRAALAAGLDTIAVLAHGHDRLYPALHRRTAEEMTQHGGLLTEYFQGTVPDKGNFVRRNRIVAGIARATLVIESAARGGALITATIAGSYGREVLAVPGRVGDPYSEGCNALIRDNKAALVTSADDVVSALGWTATGPAAAPAEPTLFPLLTPEQERIVETLRGHESLTLDGLSQALAEPVARLADILFDLEDLGQVKRMPGNRYRLRG